MEVIVGGEREKEAAPQQGGLLLTGCVREDCGAREAIKGGLTPV